MIKATMFSTSKKCLHCGTYHDLNLERCPECGRYLYTCSDVYTPKVGKGEITKVK